MSPRPLSSRLRPTVWNTVPAYMEPGENHHEQDCCLAQQTVADIPDGATAAIAGFGVADRFATSPDLRPVANSAAKELPSSETRSVTPAATRGQILAENNQVRKLIAAFSVRPGTPTASEEQIAAGKMEVGAGSPGDPGRALPRGRRRDPGVLLTDRRRYRPGDGARRTDPEPARARAAARPAHGRPPGLPASARRAARRGAARAPRGSSAIC